MKPGVWRDGTGRGGRGSCVFSTGRVFIGRWEGGVRSSKSENVFIGVTVYPFEPLSAEGAEKKKGNISDVSSAGKVDSTNVE